MLVIGCNPAAGLDVYCGAILISAFSLFIFVYITYIDTFIP